MVRLEPVADARATNPFRTRRLRPGYARLRGKLGRGTDSTRIVAEDRGGAEPA
jgi:hypothetical protein